jgi:hypothetical protein
MLNSVDYELDVLAGSTLEINEIEERLKEPSWKLISWVVEKFDHPFPGIAGGLGGLVGFEGVRSLDNGMDAARRFGVSFPAKRCGIVERHLFEVSAEFRNPARVPLSSMADLLLASKHVA